MDMGSYSSRRSLMKLIVKIQYNVEYICLSSRIWLMMHSLFLNYYCRVIIALICRLCMSPTVPYA